ncbi:MAG: M48 family metalloprotease [Desulfovibrionaceae bacterium]|nr:M48 family metalloprotease [Desulfovibrionaceae bacterium]
MRFQKIIRCLLSAFAAALFRQGIKLCLYRAVSSINCFSSGKTPAASLKLLLGFVCVQLVLLPACPAHAFGKFGISEEKELGRKFSVMIKSRLPIIEDPEIKSYIQEITARLIGAAPPQPYDFDVNVLRSDAINAFCSPGGHLFVFTGLILAMENESEVAGVMAHELAHATQRHIATRIERSRMIGLASTILALGGMFLGGDMRGAGVVAPMAAGQAAMLNYSRQDESEADQVGLNYLVRAGYPPAGMAGAFSIMRRDQSRISSAIPSYLSTHPDVSRRITDMTARMSVFSSSVKDRKDDNRRFVRIQTLVRAKYSDPDAALRFFELDTRNPKYINLMGKGILYSRLNRVAEAGRAFDEAVRLGSKEGLVWREAGIFQYSKGGPGSSEKAREYLKKAVQMRPDDYLARFYNALILGESGSFAAAESEFKEVLRRLPEDSEVHHFYGRLLGRQGKNFEAFLHLAYSNLYSNNKIQVQANRDKAEAHMKTEAQKAALERFDQKYNERKEFW